MPLRLCDACSRHVRDTETTCPFCTSALSFAPLPIAPLPRLSRAAQVAFVATVLVGCREEPKPVADPPSPPKLVADTSAPPEVPDTKAATNVVEEDTAPPPAPSPTPTPTPKIKVKTAPPVPTNLYKPYGAPPADGLLT